jgi:hypothetical protein
MTLILFLIEIPFCRNEVPSLGSKKKSLLPKLGLDKSLEIPFSHFGPESRPDFSQAMCEAKSLYTLKENICETEVSFPDFEQVDTRTQNSLYSRHMIIPKRVYQYLILLTRLF